MLKIKVVKIGGNVIDNPQKLDAFIADFARMEGPKVLVHGGGKIATSLSSRLGIETQMIDGRRVTDSDTIDIVTMVYAGLVNKRIIALLQLNGCNAIGLSGADANVLTAYKRPASPVDYGFVGDIDPSTLNVSFLESLLSMDIVPVFCAIMHDGNGILLNCNADSVASAVATGLASAGEVELHYCFEKKGVLRDVDDAASVIPVITPSNYALLKSDGSVSKGMIPKIDNAFSALSSGVSRVIIKHSDDLLTNAGTTVMK